MKPESFLKGTVILISANAISKILGAILKIPLTYILGEQGMAIYQTAFSVYIMLLSLITSGLPFAISRYVAQEFTLKRYGNARFSIKLSLLIMWMAGLILSLVMFFGADFFALSMKDPKATLAIKAIAPSIFFVAVGCVYKSCYQGYACQTPTALSQVIEALVKLIFGYFLAYWFSAFSVAYSAGAAIFGVTIGEAVATAILIIMYVPVRKLVKNHKRSFGRRKIALDLFSVALPMTVFAVVSGLLGLLDASVIRNQLSSLTFSVNEAQSFLNLYAPHTHVFDSISAGGRISQEGARWLYGAYSGYAATVFNLPAGVLASFGVAVLPVVSSAVVLKNHTRLFKTVTTAVKTILLISLPTSLMMCVFSKEILYVLFKNPASHLMLSAMAPVLVLSTLSHFICSVFNSSGNIMVPFRYMTLCNIIKIAGTYFLVSRPELNILGAIIASFFANVLFLILLIFRFKKEFNMKLFRIMDFAKITASAGLMTAISKLLLNPLTLFSGNVYVGFSASVLVGFLAYVLCLFLTSAIKKEEITHLRG